MYGLGLPVEGKPSVAYFYETEPPLGFSTGIGSILASSQGAVQDAATGFMVGGPIGAAVGGTVGAILGLFSPTAGQIQATDATTIVNGIEPILRRNVQLFMSNPTPDTQAAAENQFMNIWGSMVGQLTSLGKGGQQGVNDRAPGGKFDWWKAYLYPIQNYQLTTSVPVATSISAGDAIAASLAPITGGMSGSTLLILAAVGFGIYAMSGGNK